MTGERARSWVGSILGGVATAVALAIAGVPTSSGRWWAAALVINFFHPLACGISGKAA